MSRRIFTALTLIALTAPITHADLIPDGRQPVNHRHVIVGLDQFPDLTFFVAPTDMGGGVIALTEGQSFFFYKICAPRLYALAGAATPESVTHASLEKEALAHSEVTLRLTDSVPESDPTRRIVTTHRAVSIEGSVIHLVLESEQRFDEDGDPLSRAEIRAAVIHQAGIPLGLSAAALVLLALVGWRRRVAAC